MLLLRANAEELRRSGRTTFCESPTIALLWPPLLFVKRVGPAEGTVANGRAVAEDSSARLITDFFRSSRLAGGNRLPVDVQWWGFFFLVRCPFLPCAVFFFFNGKSKNIDFSNEV